MADTKEYNVLITNLSDINKDRASLQRYIEENVPETIYEGYSTNEAPIKLTMNNLHNAGKQLDYVIMLASARCSEKILTDNDMVADDTKVSDIDMSIKATMSDAEFKDMIHAMYELGVEREKMNHGLLRSSEAYEEKRQLAKKAVNDYKKSFEPVAPVEVPKKPVYDMRFLNHSTIEYIKEAISAYASDNGISAPAFDEPIEIANEPDEKNVIDVTRLVRERISTLAKDGKVNVYIEGNGGIRYVLTMLLSTINIVAKNNSNVRIAKVYNVAFGGKGISVIKDTTQIYASMELVAAVNEFINYGKIRSLESYISDYRGESDENLDKQIGKCMDKLRLVAEDLSLCRMDSIIEDFYGTDNIRECLENYLATASKDNNKAIMFGYVCEIILKEYEIIYGNRKVYDACERFVNIIEWCLDKDYMQQALTLCTECMPNAIIKSGMITIGENVWNTFLENRRPEYEECNDFLNYYVKTGSLQSQETVDNEALERHFVDYANTIGLSIEAASGERATITLADLKKKYTDKVVNRTFTKRLNALKEFKQLFSNEALDDAAVDAWMDKNGINSILGTRKIAMSDARTPKKLTVYELAKTRNYNVVTKVSRLNANKTFAANFAVKDPSFDGKERECDEKIAVLVDKIFEGNSERVENFLKYANTDVAEKYKFHRSFIPGEFYSDYENIIYLFRLYGIIKEQRNLTNHANVSEDKIGIALNVKQLTLCIRELVNVLDAR